MLDPATLERLGDGLRRLFETMEAADDLRARHAAEAPMLRP
jgi:hypothetical protein